jgi:osmotically-inducible protein OsmY
MRKSQLIWNSPVMMVMVLAVMMAPGCQKVSGEITADESTDMTITTSVKSQLATHDRLGTLTQITVKTVENTVYLGGMAPSLREKYRAEDISRSVDGVQKVMNFIAVFPSPTLATAEDALRPGSP